METGSDIANGSQPKDGSNSASVELKQENLETSSDELLQKVAQAENIANLLKVVYGCQNVELEKIACEVIPLVYKFLDNANVESDLQTLEAAQQLLGHLANVVEPKEYLVLLIELARECWTDARFEVVVSSAHQCISRMTTPIGNSLSFALDAFTCYLATIPLPDVQGLEHKERLLLDSDPQTMHICSTVPLFLSFIKPYVGVVSWRILQKAERKDDSDRQRQISELTRCLYRIMGRPLGRFDLSRSTNEARSRVRLLAEDCLKSVGLLHNDFARLVVCGEPDVENDAEAKLGRSTLAFLVFGERLYPSLVPSVHSPRYILELNAPHVAILLEHPDQMARLHGTKFCLRLLRRFEPCSLQAELIESEDMRQMVLAVVKGVLSAKTTEFKSSLLNVLRLTCKILEPRGKWLYLYSMLKIAPRSGGTIACLVDLLGSEIMSNLNSCNAGENYFAGQELEKLLQLVFALPNGEKTDLLDNSERIMAALKFLRLVLPKDTFQRNATGIWNMMDTIEAKYFRLLFAGIELSRSHYMLEIRKVRETRRGESSGRDFTSHGTSVELSKHQQLGVLETAVNTLDMMNEVAKQVVEMIKSLRSLSETAA